jgi:hypothetical protein
MISDNSNWRNKLWRFYHAASKWGAPEKVCNALYNAIDKLPHGKIDVSLYEAARLAARLANRNELAKWHAEPKLTAMEKRRWAEQVGSDV